MWESLPELGTAVIYGILISAAFTFAVSLAAARGQPRLLQSARWAAYGTCALIGLGVLMLAYGFVTHDFRISYIARYSDRSMPEVYLLSSLWGGQDGSILWWTFLLSVYIATCVRWLKGKYRELQPYVIATLMVIVSFFAILMLYETNPFATSIAGGRVDGDGLNPALMNFYMMIHPPTLYIGFVGCSVPFAFAVAALVTGRLDNEWIVAARKWMLFAWLFLTIGNVLGMMWAYVELGWGGYWAWDPVENAAILPWFTASAYVHSTMIQERRGMLKIWNVFLIMTTFFLTIFGTFLTRSGLISSVHAFAQSDIGTYFLWFMGIIVVTGLALLVWRAPQLTSRNQIESMASREAMFVLNNWALLAVATLVAGFTLWPKITDWIWKEEEAIGPPYFNLVLAPIGVLVFALMGLAPLFGWRKTSEKSVLNAFLIPIGALVVVAVLHLALGSSLGYPAIVDAVQLDGVPRVFIEARRVMPLLVVSLSAFNIAVIIQEFQRGVAARRRNSKENVGSALFNLMNKNRRRYGGYVVHLGIVCIFLGFVGSLWSSERETSLKPGETFQIEGYEAKYLGPRMEVDRNKRMVFADLEVYRHGNDGGERTFLGKVSPAKYIYRRQGTTTSEVSILSSVKDDFYVVLGKADPTTKSASFRFHVNVLVNWIWVGLYIMMMGAAISLWPELRYREVGAWAYVRAGTSAAAGLLFAMLIGMAPVSAQAATVSSGVRGSAPTQVRAAPPAQGSNGQWLPLTGGLVLGSLVAFGLNRRRRRTEQRS